MKKFLGLWLRFVRDAAELAEETLGIEDVEPQVSFPDGHVTNGEWNDEDTYQLEWACLEYGDSDD